MPELIGELPKPRVLVVNVPEKVAAAIEALAPTVRFVMGQGILGIRQLDWDAAVVFGDAPPLERHLYVVQIGGEWGGELPTRVSPMAVRSGSMQLKIIPRSRSIQFRIPEQLPPTVKSLMPSLVALVTAKAGNLVMWAGLQGYANETEPIIESPFMEDADNYVLAGYLLTP